ncbi:alpha/beta hydrolase family protein [Halopolyspora algeriensis]|uniref:Alpha/beta hydrolase family protein n=1 Tax=Halopolyspora algeriensis TaxID=1500506 RepID=A0A368VV52_9ACTN|nr:alpha/beta fold hydrolase [Halopolyspora algeriensis]RCW45729.1 alpha/beta hydrolase family protein [Halopolyspora algeriensis]TQM54113.1 alpha/beta hydrolase family protein [Halopolyspora algeriensis]
MTPQQAPHLTTGHEITVRRGHFWIPGERVEAEHGTVQRAPMFVHWEAPPVVTRPEPLVLVHGGGGQGTDWTGTPDGRPGWATRFVEAGFAVYVVDRCGHGRSPLHPDIVGAMGEQFPYEAAQALFLPDDARTTHTQWTYERDIGSDDLDQLLGAMGSLPADLAESQRMDADRLARLLDIVGPAVVVTHSAGGPVGWLVADSRPKQVAAIAAIEPVGPPFADFPGLGKLAWGLTAHRITYDPPLHRPEEAESADPATLRIPALADTPIAVVSGGSSAFAEFAPHVVDFLNTAGARAEPVHLPEYGITGNGHGLTFEANSDHTITPVIDWITEHDQTPIEE